MFSTLPIDEKVLVLKNLFRSPEHTEFAIFELQEYEADKERESQNNEKTSH